MPEWLLTCLLLAAGGAAGTLARFWTGKFVAEVQQARWPELEFPFGTFIINVSGSLVLGFLAAVFVYPPEPEPARRHWYLLLGAGFCGGFTTFSTFSLETYELLRDGKRVLAVVYALGSVIAGVFGVWCAVRMIGK